MDRALGGSLVSLLAVEEQTLSGLRCPGSNVVGNAGGLVGLERCQGLGVDGISSEPEVLLGVENVPEALLVTAPIKPSLMCS